KCDLIHRSHRVRLLLLVIAVTLVDGTRWLFRQHEASEFTPPLETLTNNNNIIKNDISLL
ncbi:hypothetical protein, partial [Alicyclobacillus pomorum]|uniref:hypothetical protein n=1 Tax=Alicyclobacillus pomorum TaxID=204470 RepID=UPI0039EFB64A